MFGPVYRGKYRGCAVRSPRMARETGSIRWHRGGWELSWHEGTRRRYRRVSAPNTRAGRRRAEIELERLQASTGEPTVAELLEDYRASKWAGWSPSQRAKWPSNTTALIAELGDRIAHTVTPSDIERVYTRWRSDGLAASTVRRRHVGLAAAFNRSERLEIILRAPTRHVELPRAPDIAPVDLPDMTTVLAAVMGWNGPEWLTAALRVTLATGMRRGELAAMRWSDVDLDDGCLWVRAAVAADETGVITRKATKARRASAAEALDPGTIDVLRAWQATQKSEARVLGVRWLKSWPVIGDRADPRKPIRPENITRAWTYHRRKLGLEAVGWHDLRHINASELVAAGIDPTTAARRLGHDPAMLLGRYAHARPVQDRAAAEVIATADERARRRRG